MKTTKFFFVLFAFLGLMIAGCTDEQSPVSPVDKGSLEKVIHTPFTLVNFPIGIIDPGTVKVEDGKWIIRKFVVRERFNTVPVEFSGVMINTLNATLDYGTGEGRVWGSFTITPDVGDGIWEGSYQGTRTRIETSKWEIDLQIVGHGKGGDLQGKQVFSNDIITATTTPPQNWLGAGSGFIKYNEN